MKQQLFNALLTATVSVLFVQRANALESNEQLTPAIAPLDREISDDEQNQIDTSEFTSIFQTEESNAIAHSTAPNVQQSVPREKIPRVTEIERSLHSAKWLQAQDGKPIEAGESTVVKVTGVRLNSTQSGLEVILETQSGQQLQAVTRSEGNSAYADISNTVLALPSGNEFRAEKPVEGIASVVVTQLDANSIRVSVTGTDGVPTAQVQSSDRGLVLGFTKPAEGDEEIEIVVTGEQDGYRVPDATTGTRLDIPLLDTPASVGVITNELIEDKAARRVEDLAPYVSGVTAGDIAQGGLFTDFTIRGFSTNRTVYVNGLRDNVRNLVRDFANIERLEILKGFSSLLYGTGSPGGVVNYVTKKPQADPSYRVSFDAGSFNFYRGEADLTGPLTQDKNLLYRLILAFQRADYFVPNVEDNRIFVAPSLTLRTGGGGTLTVEGEYYQQDKDFHSGAKFFNGEFFFDRSYTDPRNSNIYNHYRVSTYFDQPIGKQWSLNLSGQYFYTRRDLDSLFTAISFRGNTLQRFYRTIFDDYHQYNLRGEVRGNFNIGASEHKLLAGVEYNRFRTDFTGALGTFFGSIDVANPTFDVPIPTGIREAPAYLSEKDSGIYIQDFVKLGRFRLLAGLRYGRFQGDSLNQGTTREIRTQEGDFISPSVGLVYNLTDSASLYASFSQSTQPQTGSFSNGDLVDPRTATQYEIGAKVNLLNNRLSITTALYNLKQTNIGEADPSNPGFNILVGDIRSRGFELDIAGRITNNFSLIAAYTLQDAEITKSILGLEGNTPINSPRHSLGIYGKYEFTDSALKGLSLGTGLVFVGERKGDNANTFDLPSYVRVDLGADYKVNNLTFRLAIENLFNERYATGSQNRANITQGLPFAVTGSVSIQF